MRAFDYIGRLVLIAMAVVLTTGVASATPDELYYPASNCQPFSGSGWQGGGSSGFGFHSLTGGLYNYDKNNAEPLVCPIPYYRNTHNLERITVRVVVDDGHPLDSFRVFLCGRNAADGASGQKICDSDDNFPSVFGFSTIELSIQPNSGTRFVWLEVVVPENAEDNSPWTENGPSGVLGYRVIRN